MEDMLVHFIFITCDRPNMSTLGLKSILACEYPHWRMSVVDDGVTHRFRNTLKRVIPSSVLPRVELYETGDTLELKEKRGSVHGRYLNHVIKTSDADLFVLVCDDDAVVHQNIPKMIEFYKANPEVQYAWNYIAPFDPYLEVPDLPNQAGRMCTWNGFQGGNGAAKLDGSQVTYRKSASRVVEYPEFSAGSLDAVSFEQMFRAFGPPARTNLFLQFKGISTDNMAVRSSEKHYLPRDRAEPVL